MLNRKEHKDKSMRFTFVPVLIALGVTTSLFGCGSSDKADLSSTVE
jgi:hypothetical protein